MNLKELLAATPLPTPDLYAHELIRNGRGIWLGCVEQGICEQAHVPGETGEEVRQYFTTEQLNARALSFAETVLQKCLELCEKIADEARGVVDSKVLTPAGRVLHEGMYGGAKNCMGAIQNLLALPEESNDANEDKDG